ncbi:MAG: hypothetical protein GF398_12620 [Chitinivibrionales bacterium]|nr:hypothetical protein [Chitinivibrionales bacterium]
MNCATEKYRLQLNRLTGTYYTGAMDSVKPSIPYKNALPIGESGISRHFPQAPAGIRPKAGMSGIGKVDDEG